MFPEPVVRTLPPVVSLRLAVTGPVVRVKRVRRIGIYQQGVRIHGKTIGLFNFTEAKVQRAADLSGANST